jgi:hypothetical protein
MQIDVATTSTPDNYPRDVCRGRPCVPLFPIGDSSGMVSYVEAKNRFIIVDVEGETVIIDISASADKFDVFLPKAQQVLDTVTW